MTTVAKLIATFFGSGYSPVAPGTMGAALALIISYFTHQFYGENIYFYVLLIGIALSFGLGVWSTNVVQKEWGDDPSRVVIDEACGLWISLLLVPFSLTNGLIAFAFFRFFDILKPFGIRKLDNLHSAYGVMLDDVLAGIYAAVCTFVVVQYVLPLIETV